MRPFTLATFRTKLGVFSDVMRIEDGISPDLIVVVPAGNEERLLRGNRVIGARIGVYKSSPTGDKLCLIVRIAKTAETKEKP